jgi:hypothetical protein
MLKNSINNTLGKFKRQQKTLRIISERVGDPLRIQGIKDSSQMPKNYKE